MRNILLTFMIFLVLSSCKKDDTVVFDKSMPSSNITFKTIQGGAVMHYSLPNDETIFAINVRYKDCSGLDVLKVAGYGSDSVILDGFNGAQKGIPVQITLVDNKNNESKPINMSFDTEDSAPYAFFDHAQVTPYWDGFQLKYDLPGAVSGMAHIFYLGVNPMTHKSDTILMKSFPIIENKGHFVFSLKQVRDKNTVIVRTEDFRGYRVKEQVYTDVESYKAMQLLPTNFDFIDVNKLSIESDPDMVGAKYLFDGDLKGENRIVDPERGFHCHTFLAGPNAVGAPFILDMREQKLPAKIVMYGDLYTPWSFPSKWEQGNTGTVWLGTHCDKLPCKVTVYGGNNKDGADDTWVELGKYEQDPNLKGADRWSFGCGDNREVVNTLAKLQAKKAAFLEVPLEAQTERFQFVKIIVNEVFNSHFSPPSNKNADKFVNMSELEVFIKKD